MAQRTINGYPECWFSRLLARKGDDYITSGKLTDDEVLRNIDRIISDIINGKIDYSVYGNYVLLPVVFDNLLSFCRSRYNTTSAELYCLGYVNWACETGIIQVANLDRYFPNGQYDLSQVQPPFTHDVSLWNNGISTISTSTKNTISTAIRDISFENSKFKVLTEILESIQTTRNIFELQWATNGLKQYIRSNNSRISI